MILQRDERLIPQINEFGCYLMSIFFLVNKWTNFPFSPELINDLYHKLHKQGWIDDQCTVLNPQAIFGYLGMDVAYTDRHESPGRICMADEIEILKFYSRYGDHFVVGNGMGHIAYDPYGESKAVKYGQLESKRIFRRL